MEDKPIEIPNLTQDEIEHLQVDASLRLIGSNTALMNRLGRQIGSKMLEVGRIKQALGHARKENDDIWREWKRTRN